jgi:hypothetical protein
MRELAGELAAGSGRKSSRSLSFRRIGRVVELATPVERVIAVSNPTGGLKKMSRTRRVLVIDDDRLLCELVRTTFELEGYEVETAYDVIEAERVLAGSAA